MALWAFLISVGVAVLPNAEPSDLDKWNAYYLDIARKYTISMNAHEGNESAVLKLVDLAALHWTNPQRAGDTHGAFFVWTYNGRAEAVGTIFSYHYPESNTYRTVAHEFHSLSAARLNATLKGTVVWSPQADSLEFKQIERAKPPVKSRALRLAQMRRLAAEFTARLQTGDNEDDDQELRILPQPLYRYEAGSKAVLDGAIFTMVLGTDPECLLMIESRETDAGKQAWYFAAARFTHASFRMYHRGKVVFSHIKGTESETDRFFRYVCFRNGRAPLKVPE